jgi:flagellar biosynthesis protein FlhB
LSKPENERTEEPTSRRRDKEREKGNIPKSQDFNAALMVTIGICLIGVLSTSILSNLYVMLYETFTNLKPQDISTNDVMATLLPYFGSASKILLPFLLILMFAGIIIVRMQVGPVFAPDKIKFNLETISPSRILENARKMLNPAETRNLVEFIKSLVKLLIVFFCGYATVNGRKDELFGLLGLNIESSFAIINSILTQMLINMCLAMLLLGFLDKKYQDYEYEKSIKMSKQEIKDEMKDTEGDPKIKARIRSIQMKIARQRMLSKVATADVVVTNPTHYAVALEYKRMKNSAPKVVAKGVDFIAFKIRDIAQENKIPIVENPPLARAIYKLVPIDGIIPSDMFVAVAEVLAYVYSKNKSGGK